MAVKELVEIKFRLADGGDIGPNKYASSTTVGSLKEKLITQWPKDNDSGPRTTNDVKLINAGRILENSRTLSESRLPVAEVPGGVITMHVVVRPPIHDKNNDKLKEDSPTKGGCACTILISKFSKGTVHRPNVLRNLAALCLGDASSRPH